MTRHVAFLRGINLGKRRMKMADLATCMTELGFTDVRTILASGNVRFDAEPRPALQSQIETALTRRFGFAVGVVLRTADEIEAMLVDHPFAQLPADADVARHVLLFAEPLPAGLSLTGLTGDTEILRIDPREIYIAGYRRPNGRYTEGVAEALKPLYARVGTDTLDTMRNWNTMGKLLA